MEDGKWKIEVRSKNLEMKMENGEWKIED